jgi:acyl-coenzyme A thioesterase PaaI-like protein
MKSTARNFALNAWQRLSRYPGGKWLFTRIVCFKAPYFSSIRPTFTELRPGYSTVRMRKRRRVQNHIGTVHAIAMCNLAELAAGTMTEVTVPSSYRWIPKGMTVEYLAKAETDLHAIAEIDPIPAFDKALEVPVVVKVVDAADALVLRATINMWVTPRTP